MRERNSIRRTVAIISSICVWISALLQTLQAFNFTGGTAPEFNVETGALSRSLDINFLKSYWAWKRDQRGVDVLIVLLLAIGLFGLSYCTLVLKRVFKRYKHGDSDIPGFMAGCFFLGATLCGISLLNTLGNTTTADFISSWAELPDVGLQALHISFTLNRGSFLYMFSSQFILIPVGLLLYAYLAITTSDMSPRHAIFGVVVAMFGLLTFAFLLIVFNTTEMALSAVFGVILLIYGVLLLPIWMIWLGIELRRIKQEQKGQDRDDEIEIRLNEVKNKGLAERESE